MPVLSLFSGYATDYSSAAVIFPIEKTLKKALERHEDTGIMGMKKGMA